MYGIGKEMERVIYVKKRGKVFVMGGGGIVGSRSGVEILWYF